MTRGQSGLLFLSCQRLSLFTLCRSPGALTCFIIRFVSGALKAYPESFRSTSAVRKLDPALQPARQRSHRLPRTRQPFRGIAATSEYFNHDEHLKEGTVQPRTCSQGNGKALRLTTHPGKTLIMRNFLLVLIALILAPFTYGLSLLLLFGLRGKPKPITQTVIVGGDPSTAKVITTTNKKKGHWLKRVLAIFVGFIVFLVRT
jgi:hypothetical protein